MTLVTNDLTDRRFRSRSVTFEGYQLDLGLGRHAIGRALEFSIGPQLHRITDVSNTILTKQELVTLLTTIQQREVELATLDLIGLLQVIRRGMFQRQQVST